MVSSYIVVGSRGIVGNQVVTRLRQLGKLVIIKTTSEILQSTEAELSVSLVSSMAEYSVKPSVSSIGLILAHRYRGNDIKCALDNERCITRDFTWGLTKLCVSLRVVVLGSITGGRIDRSISEAYHYSKDLQKSIVRQSIRIDNLHMNLLELNWFEKYPEAQASDEYRQIMVRLKQKLGRDNLPNVDSITDFACALIEMSPPPRGQSIVYDGGLSMFQSA